MNKVKVLVISLLISMGIAACGGGGGGASSNTGSGTSGGDTGGDSSGGNSNGNDSSAYTGPLLQFSNVTETNLPAGLTGQCMDAAVADMDNDADLDIVLAIEFQKNILLENDGTGIFSIASPGLPETLRDSEDIGIADFDNDGMLDIIFVSEDDATNELFLNNGNGNYTDASNRITASGTSNAVEIADISGNGATDILIGNVGLLNILVNDGTGNFNDETASRFPTGSYQIQDLTLADIDMDNDLDLLTADEQQNRIFINDGNGNFSDETNSRLPELLDETREVITADVDGDGDLDIYYANVSFLFGFDTKNRLLLNNGLGVFQEVSNTNLEPDTASTFTAKFVELTGDEAIDLIVPQANISNGSNISRSYANNGTGEYAETALNLPEGNGLDVEVADFNADGHNDIYFCNRSAGDQGVIGGAGGQDALLFGGP